MGKTNLAVGTNQRPASPTRMPCAGVSANSGGAIYHRETLEISNTSFWENTAGEEGFAVLGSTSVALNNVSFASNTFRCASGEYLHEDSTLGVVSRDKNLPCLPSPNTQQVQ